MLVQGVLVLGWLLLCAASPSSALAAQLEETPIDELQEIYDASMGLWDTVDRQDAMLVLDGEGSEGLPLPPVDVTERFERMFGEMYQELVAQKR